MSRDDLRAINELLPELYALRDLATLPGVMLRLVSRVIPNLFCTYNELNLRTGSIVARYHPPEWQARMEALMPRLAPHVDQHPVYRHVNETGDGSARAIADFLDKEAWCATDFGRELATIGVTEDLIFCLRTSQRVLIFIALNRGEPDFSARDRAVANLLRAHFAVAHDNAAAFTASQAMAALAQRSLDVSPYGLALVDHDGRVLHVNATALELIDRHFPGGESWQTSLPAPVHEWLERTTAMPVSAPRVYEWKTASAHVEVRCADAGDNRRALLFREVEEPNDTASRVRQLGLSKREAEVLHWAAEGKSNAEIGTILFISPRTVGKHLEAIYRKLGFESRRAAMLWVHQRTAPAGQDGTGRFASGG